MPREGQEVAFLGEKRLGTPGSQLVRDRRSGAEPAAHKGEGVTCSGRRPMKSPDPRPPHSRSARESEDEDEEEEERRPSASRGCTLQYQHATLQVFTQFHTTSSEGADQVVPMLGPDWLVEVTDLVSDFMRVGDPRVARMVDSSTLAGLEPGTTPFKVGTGAPCGQRTQTSQEGQGFCPWDQPQQAPKTHSLPRALLPPPTETPLSEVKILSLLLGGQSPCKTW